MHILHTESSSGWGGQEMRILREAEGMRKKGHESIFAVQSAGKLIAKAKEAGFVVYELPFSKRAALKTLYTLMRICRGHQIDLINTHSSLDAWLAGITARLCGVHVVRTRHLSTPIRKGLNSRLLYGKLADFVVTTSSGIIPLIAAQAKIPLSSLRCVPTGIDEKAINPDPKKSAELRASWGIKPSEVLVGTACFVRSWKGIMDFLQAAALLKNYRYIKWVVVGGGYVDEYKPRAKELGLEGRVFFTGHLESPFEAMLAMDIFALLSTAHEGISQASLQAAFLQRPLITTSVGGLPEVCLQDKTGFVVPPFSPEKVAEAVLSLADNPLLRCQMGKAARQLVLERYTFAHTLDAMHAICTQLRS